MLYSSFDGPTFPIGDDTVIPQICALPFFAASIKGKNNMRKNLKTTVTVILLHEMNLYSSTPCCLVLCGADMRHTSAWTDLGKMRNGKPETLSRSPQNNLLLT